MTESVFNLDSDSPASGDSLTVELLPNQTSHFRYYAICTLNQFTMEQEDQELAKSLVDVYFTFFKVRGGGGGGGGG